MVRGNRGYPLTRGGRRAGARKYCLDSRAGTNVELPGMEASPDADARRVAQLEILPFIQLSSLTLLDLIGCFPLHGLMSVCTPFGGFSSSRLQLRLHACTHPVEASSSLISISIRLRSDNLEATAQIKRSTRNSTASLPTEAMVL